MSYCLEFFRKWRKEGNFCGLGEGEACRIDGYLNLVDTLMKHKIPEKTIVDLFTVGVFARQVSQDLDLDDPRRRELSQTLSQNV